MLNVSVHFILLLVNVLSVEKPGGRDQSAGVGHNIFWSQNWPPIFGLRLFILFHRKLRGSLAIGCGAQLATCQVYALSSTETLLLPKNLTIISFESRPTFDFGFLTGGGSGLSHYYYTLGLATTSNVIVVVVIIFTIWTWYPVVFF